ncbi:MAG: anti-phage dCTP deaminase [Burkholderiales bacterium]
MAVSVKNIVGEKQPDVADLFSIQRAGVTIEKTHTNELVIALCGPIGSPLHEVAEAIKTRLADIFGYEQCTEIRLSSLISEYAHKVSKEIPERAGFDKIRKQIDAGNALRKEYGASVLVELAVNVIRVDREQHKIDSGSASYLPRRVCHIIDSIKNQEELDLLRMVYREMLYVVGVFSPLEQREGNLKLKGLDSAEVYQLIDRDSGEESQTGQTVRDTFPQSDFFLRMDSGTDSQLSRQVERFLHLILGTKIITPTSNESAMYAAASAAANSACLSRQVGAAVTTSNGEIVSTGWNDVPKKGGGLYSYNSQDPTGDNDKRCWNIKGGKCFNDEEKSIFADQLMDTLKEFIPDRMQQSNVRTAIASFSKLKGLIEFSRSIHAEMHAILNAGKVAGSKIVDGKLFVTTYPCHSCARHIVAAGISEVFYIEPYRKSLAIKLHGDAISERETDIEKVRLLPFDGVAPGRYLDLFKVHPDSRKNNGMMIKVAPKDAMPKLEKSMQAVPELEGLVVESLLRNNLITLEEVGDGQDNTAPAA